MPLYGRFLREDAPLYAEVEDQTAHFIGDLFGDRARNGQSAPLSQLQILPPVAPSKLLAIGLNYAAHAAEHGNEVPAEPLMWFKAPSSLLAHNGVIEVAFPAHRTDYEAELAIVIGHRGKAIAREQAPDYILGYCAAQDISDRVIQRGESQWARAKSLDTYTPIGPFIHTDVDPLDLSVQTLINGEVRQDGHTRDLIFSPFRIVEFVSQAITLEAGDVILTGTPAGVGPLADGDTLETRIGAWAPLVNRVKFAH